VAPYVGLVVFIGALVWLYLAKSRDIDRAASLLGLSRVKEKVESRGTTAEGLAFHELLWLTGTLEGMPAEVAERRLRLPINDTFRRQRSSHFTVLRLDGGAEQAPGFRLQPVGLMGGLESLLQETPAITPTGDPAFDSAYRLYADQGSAAILRLTPELRQAILAMRAKVAGKLPASAAGYLASGLLLGTFECEAGRASYTVYGTPNRKIAEHLREVAPLLARLAGRR